MDPVELREQITELLERQLKLANGQGGMISADAATAIHELTSAYADLTTQVEEE